MIIKEIEEFQDGGIATERSDLCGMKLIFKKREKVHVRIKLWENHRRRPCERNRNVPDLHQKSKYTIEDNKSVDPGRKMWTLMSQVREESMGPWHC